MFQKRQEKYQKGIAGSDTGKHYQKSIPWLEKAREQLENRRIFSPVEFRQAVRLLGSEWFEISHFPRAIEVFSLIASCDPFHSDESLYAFFAIAGSLLNQGKKNQVLLKIKELESEKISITENDEKFMNLQSFEFLEPFFIKMIK